MSTDRDEWVTLTDAQVDALDVGTVVRLTQEDVTITGPRPRRHPHGRPDGPRMVRAVSPSPRRHERLHPQPPRLPTHREARRIVRPGGDMSEPIVTTTITITEELSDDGVSTELRIEPEDAPLVTILGLLRLAEDTVIRAAMGADDD